MPLKLAGRLKLNLKDEADEEEAAAAEEEEEEERELQTFQADRYRADYSIGGRQVHGAHADPFNSNADLDFELSKEIIDLEVLQWIASRGHLDVNSRPIVWKLLLGYLPPKKNLWAGELLNNVSRYTELRNELIINPSEFSRNDDGASSSSSQDGESEDTGLLFRHQISSGDHPLSLGRGSIWNQYFRDAEIVEQINRDIQRTHPDLSFFSGDSASSRKNRETMRNILLIFAKLNPTIGYVQGMNEVLAVLYYVFCTRSDEHTSSNVEADTFWCFVHLLSGSVDHFVQQLDNSSVGILATLSHLSEMMKVNDEELWRHLENCKMNPQFYAFRWITLLLTQEFGLESIMRIWDCLLSNPLGVQEMLLRVCCAMLLCIRRELLNGDFMLNLRLLQHYPDVDLEHLLDVAHHLTPVPTHHPFSS